MHLPSQAAPGWTPVVTKGGKNAPTQRELLIANPALLLETVGKLLTLHPPAGVSGEYVASFFRRHHAELLAVTTDVCSVARRGVAPFPLEPAYEHHAGIFAWGERVMWRGQAWIVRATNPNGSVDVTREGSDLADTAPAAELQRAPPACPTSAARVASDVEKEAEAIVALARSPEASGLLARAAKLLLLAHRLVSSPLCSGKEQTMAYEDLRRGADAYEQARNAIERGEKPDIVTTLRRISERVTLAAARAAKLCAKAPAHDATCPTCNKRDAPGVAPFGYVYAVDGAGTLHVWPVLAEGDQLLPAYKVVVENLPNRRGYAAIKVDPALGFDAEVERTRDTWNRAGKTPIASVKVHPVPRSAAPVPVEQPAPAPPSPTADQLAFESPLSGAPISATQIEQLGPGSEVRFKSGGFGTPLLYAHGEVLRYYAQGNGTEWVVRWTSRNMELAIPTRDMVWATPSKARRDAATSSNGRNAPASSGAVTPGQRGAAYARLFAESGAEALLGMSSVDVMEALHAFDEDEKIPKRHYGSTDVTEFKAGVASVAGAATVKTDEGGMAGPVITEEDAAEGLRVVVKVHPEGLRHGVIYQRHSFVTRTRAFGIGAGGLVPVEDEKREVSYQIVIQMDSGRKVHHHDELRAELAQPPGLIALDIVSSAYGGRPEPMAPDSFWTRLRNVYAGVAHGLEKADLARLPAKKAEWRKSSEASRVSTVALLDVLDNWLHTERGTYPWSVPWEVEEHELRKIRLDVRTSRTATEDSELALLKAVPKDFRSRVAVGDPVRTLIFDGAQRQADGWWLVGIDGNDASLSTADPKLGPAPVKLTVKLWMVRLDAAAKARAASAAARPAASAAAPGSDARHDGSSPPYAFLAAVEKAGHKGKAIYVRDLAALVTPPDSSGWGHVSRGIVAKVSKQYFAAHGLDVRTTVDSGSMISSVTFRPPDNSNPDGYGRGRWTSSEVARLHSLMGGLRIWTDAQSAAIQPYNKGGRLGDAQYDDFGEPEGPSIPALYVEEYATLMALAEQQEGRTLTPEGTELVEIRRARRSAELHGMVDDAGGKPLAALSRPVFGGVTLETRQEAAAGCVDTTFTLPPYGSIRVVCGQAGRRDVWHNVYVNTVRYGYNGGRWAKGQQPPAPVMAAVRERGITTFGTA